MDENLDLIQIYRKMKNLEKRIQGLSGINLIQNENTESGSDD